MTNDQGDSAGQSAGDSEAEKREVAASLLGSTEWQEKLAAARKARAKVLAARTTDPERRLKEALAKTAEPHRARSAKSSPPSPSPPPPKAASSSQAARPPLAADSAPSMPGVADRPAPPRGEYAELQSPAPGGRTQFAPRPRRRFSIGVIVGLLLGLLLGVGLGAGALAYLGRADPDVDIQTWLRGVIGEALRERSDLQPAAVEISPAPTGRSQ